MANPKETRINGENGATSEPISESYLSSLISFAGNDETKLITLCALQPGIVYDLPSINQRIKQLLGENQSPYIGHTLFRDYLQKSLVFTEAVVKVETEIDGADYRLSPDNSQSAIALAGHLLQFSERHPDIPLGAALAKSSSSGKVDESSLAKADESKKRAPSTRIRIFRKVLTSQLPIRITDLATSLGESPKILRSHLNNLTGQSLVNYESAPSNEPLVAYRTTETIPTSDFFEKSRYPILSLESYNAVVQITQGDTTRRAYLEELVAKMPSRTTGGYIHGKGIESARVAALKNLARNGFIIVERFDGSMRSEINLTDTQRNYLSELVSVLDRFQSQDPTFIQEGMQIASEIISDPNRVYSLMLKAKNHSPSANSKPEPERRTEVLAVFPTGQSLQAKDLQKLFERRFGRKLSRFHINDLLGQLARTGLVEYKIEKNHKYWSLSQTN